MANPLFTPEQLAYLDSRYARIPHDHSWEQVKDTDGQTVSDAFANVDEAVAELAGMIGEEDEDEEDEAEEGDE